MFDGSLIKLIQDVAIGLRNNTTAKRQVAAAKTPASLTRKTIAPKPKNQPTEEVATPVLTYGSNALSAHRYNAPQLNVSRERLEKLKVELQKEAEAKQERMRVAVKTYEADLERLKSQKSEFSVLSGGFGPTSQRVKSAVETWEREHRSLISSLKAPAARPAGQQSQIKTCGN